MKKIFSLFFSVMILLDMLSFACVAANKVELKLTSEKVYAGDEFTLNLFISDNSQMSGAVIDLLYDSDKLQYVSADPGGILDPSANISIRNIDGENPSVRFTYLAPSSSVTSAGVLFTVKFKALDSASGSTEIKISVPNAGDFITADLESIPYTAVNSTVEIIGTGNVGETVSEEMTELPSSSDETETATEILSESESVSTELPAENSDSKNKDNTIWIIAVVFTAVAIIAVSIAIIVLRSRKKK